MRPHVEIIDEKDLIWHMAELPHATGTARQRNLNYCEEKGEASLTVEFVTDWSRPAGVHAAQTEWYILEGEIKFGDQTLIKGDYWIAPIGILTPAIEAKAGTKILLFREYADWQFEVRDSSLPTAKPHHKLCVTKTSEMEWFDIQDPVNGSPMDFETGGIPVPGLFIKLLHHDTETGFYTRLIKAKPGWKEHPLAHHPCYEEAYCLEGEFDFNYGKMWPGTYFFRPALVRHGDFAAGEQEGTTWILRCDGRLVDWYTDNARVEMHGDAVNWGPEYPGTQEPVLLQPVRSRSIGDWQNRFYQ
jgi:quercetin dioxygenase-like cupin family protein